MNERYRHFKSPKRKWFEEDVELFLLVVMLFSRVLAGQQSLLEMEQKLDNGHWSSIAGLFPYKSGEECKFKYLLVKKNNLQKYPWTA